MHPCIACFKAIARCELCIINVSFNLYFSHVGFVGKNYFSTSKEASILANEFRERLISLSFGESVEFAYALKRLENCKEHLLEL